MLERLFRLLVLDLLEGGPEPAGLLLLHFELGPQVCCFLLGQGQQAARLLLVILPVVEELGLLLG